MLQIKNHKDGKNVIIYNYDNKNKFIFIISKQRFEYYVALAKFEKTENAEPRLVPELEGYSFTSDTTKEDFDKFLEFQDREDTDSDEYFDDYEALQEISTIVSNDEFSIDLFFNRDTLTFEFFEDDSHQFFDIKINTDKFISLLENK